MLLFQAFPIPRDVERYTSPYRLTGQAEEIEYGLHYKIRRRQNSRASRILKYDWLFRVCKRKQEIVTDEQVTNYKLVVRDASMEEIERHDVIFCTCSVSSTSKIAKCVTEVAYEFYNRPQQNIRINSHKTIFRICSDILTIVCVCSE